MIDSLLVSKHALVKLLKITIDGIHTEKLGSGNQPWDNKVSKIITETCVKIAIPTKDIYSWYKDGKSMGKIAKMLNSNKIPTKKGGIWAKKTISKILKNPVYSGYLHWEQYINKSDHEKIISKSDYNEIQNLIKNHGGLPAQKLT